MARYVGPTASIDHILQKLSVIFGTVASFGILMQNVYKVTQGNNEKVPSFATRLEGTLNQIQLQCPRRMMAMEVHTAPQGLPLSWVCKYICDSVLGTCTVLLVPHICN